MAIRYSYTDTTTNVRAVGDAIYNTDYNHAPLLQLLGFDSGNESKIAIKSGWPSTKLEWLEDVNTAFTTLLTEAVDGSETGIDITVGTGQYFRSGDVLAVYAAADTARQTCLERYIVVSVSTDTLTVVRNYDALGASSAATTGDLVVLETRAVPENFAYATEHITTPTAPYNYTQIIPAAVEMSRTEAKMTRYGIEDHLDMQVAKLFDNGGTEGRLAKLLHGIFYYGRRLVRDTSTITDGVGSAGGFDTFVTTTTASTSHVFSKSGAALTKADIHTVMRAANDAGGRITHAVMGAWLYEKVHTFYEDQIRTTEDQTLRGTRPVEVVRTPHGEVKLLYDYQCPPGNMYFLNSEMCGWLPFDDFMRSTVYGGDANNPNDGRIEKVVGEYTFFLRNPKSFGKISNISMTT